VAKFQVSRSVFDQVRTCAHFRVNEKFLDAVQTQSKAKSFRRPAALDILRRVASGLRQTGYKVGDPKPGKGCDAVLRWNPLITVVLNVAERKGGIVKCDLLTFRSRSLLNDFFDRNKPTEAQFTEQWAGFCLAIDKQLRESVRADSVTWLTRKEAESQWSAAVESQ